jgi:uncharacterized protein YutE (UPF0331/DUF86 family)
MSDFSICSEILNQLSWRIERIRSRCPAELEDLAKDEDLLEILSYNLFVTVQACLDLTTHVIASQGWEPAATAREGFERLAMREVTSQEAARSLSNAVLLRNDINWHYNSIDPARIHAAAKSGLADLERFAEEVSAWTAGRLS